MNSFNKQLLPLVFIPFFAGAGFFQMADYAKKTALPSHETEIVVPGTHETVLSDQGMIGEIRMFAGNFAPRGWALCEGQIMPINQNSALFSILGTTYGGDGRTVFRLPDLRGRVAVGKGTGKNLSEWKLGQKKGREADFLQKQKIKKGTSTQEVSVATTNKITTFQPSLGMNYIICIQGIYPSRN